MDIGSAVSRKQGVDSAKILELAKYQESRSFTDTEKLCLEYADHMTETPAEVPDLLFRRLQEKFDDASIVELTSVIAWENYRARFNHALGAESEGYSDGTSCQILMGKST